MKFPIKDFFSKGDQIRKKLRIWSHLLKISLMENVIFWAVILEVKWRRFLRWVSGWQVTETISYKWTTIWR